MTSRTFRVTCIHCGVTVLVTPQIQGAHYDRLVRHLTTVHPTTPFYTSTLTRVLDHFVVQPEPSETSGSR